MATDVSLGAALQAALISPNELDSNFEPANVVDGLFAIARSLVHGLCATEPSVRGETLSLADMFDGTGAAMAQVLERGLVMKDNNAPFEERGRGLVEVADVISEQLGNLAAAAGQIATANGGVAAAIRERREG